MSVEIKKEIQLEIAHVLFIDIVAYSKMATDDQRAAVEKLNQIAQSSWLNSRFVLYFMLWDRSCSSEAPLLRAFLRR